jgi:5-methylcytosine-specific restriction protein A
MFRRAGRESRENRESLQPHFLKISEIPERAPSNYCISGQRAAKTFPSFPAFPVFKSRNISDHGRHRQPTNHLPRPALSPHRRQAVHPRCASTTQLATWESGCAECGEVFEVVTTTRVRKLRGPNRPIEPFYSSPEWRALVREMIAVRGRRCEGLRCEASDVGAAKLYGDHIHEPKDGAAALDPGNVMIRCAPCHGRKTAQWARRRPASR